MIIKSSTTLRNDYITISNLAHESEEPIYITKNGEGDLVVLSIDAFERMEETIKLKAKLEFAAESRLNEEETLLLESLEKDLGRDMEKSKYIVKILLPAQHELEKIQDIHFQLVGLESSLKVTDKILNNLDKLKDFPYLGSLHKIII